MNTFLLIHQLVDYFQLVEGKTCNIFDQYIFIGSILVVHISMETPSFQLA